MDCLPDPNRGGGTGVLIFICKRGEVCGLLITVHLLALSLANACATFLILEGHPETSPQKFGQVWGQSF